MLSVNTISQYLESGTMLSIRRIAAQYNVVQYWISCPVYTELYNSEVVINRISSSKQETWHDNSMWCKPRSLLVWCWLHVFLRAQKWNLKFGNKWSGHLEATWNKSQARCPSDGSWAAIPLPAVKQVKICGINNTSVNSTTWEFNEKPKNKHIACYKPVTRCSDAVGLDYRCRVSRMQNGRASCRERV